MNRMVDLISAVKRETALPDDRFLGVGIAIPSFIFRLYMVDLLFVFT